MTASFTISLDLQAAAELAVAWSQAPETVARELRRATTEATLLLEREVKEITPVGVHGEGGLRGSIAAREPVVLADQVIGAVGTGLAYAVPVELGTRPHFPPVQPLADWARVKLGVPADQARGVGFAIARAIARRGTQGAFMFTRAFAANRAQIERMFAAARARIRDMLAGERP